MVVNELRNAVIDTVEFIIPPFIKLIIALIVGNYVTSGILTHYLNSNVFVNFKSLEISKLKIIIDSLYLSSIVPIVAILFMILSAYAINRISSFFGSLVPIRYRSTSMIRDPYFAAQIWKYFPQIKDSYELRLKVTQLLSLVKTSNFESHFDQINRQKGRMQKKFDNINFIKFLLFWSIGTFFIVNNYIAPTLNSDQLLITILVLFILLIIMHFQVVRDELDSEITELMILDDFLRASTDYKKTEDLSEIEQIERLIKESQSNKRWWSLSIGYRLDWLKMHKHYLPPFYWEYKLWKNRKEARRKRPLYGK